MNPVRSYVRLLGETGEFTAEVPTGDDGRFRFFAAPGAWTLRTLAPRSEPVDTLAAGSPGTDHRDRRRVARSLTDPSQRAGLARADGPGTGRARATHPVSGGSFPQQGADLVGRYRPSEEEALG